MPGAPCRDCGAPTWVGLFAGWAVTICTTCDLKPMVPLCTIMLGDALTW